MQKQTRSDEYKWTTQLPNTNEDSERRNGPIAGASSKASLSNQWPPPAAYVRSKSRELPEKT
eukprot:4827838-Amphidinium_carterae.1